MMGRLLLDLYEVEPEQAVELVCSLGGEAERLMLAMRWAESVCADIDKVADRQPQFLAKIAYRSIPAKDMPPGLMGLLAAGAEHWRAKAVDHRYALRVLEVSL